MLQFPQTPTACAGTLLSIAANVLDIGGAQSLIKALPCSIVKMQIYIPGLVQFLAAAGISPGCQSVAFDYLLRVLGNFVGKKVTKDLIFVINTI